MSQENVELWRAQIEQLRAGTSAQFDHEAAISKMAEIWDPEIELDVSEAPAFDLIGVHRGIGAVQQWWREWFDAWETLRFEYELVDAGDRAVMLLDLRMRGRSSGIEVPLGEHAWVTTFRDGLITHSKLYMSQSEAPRSRRAAGVGAVLELAGGPGCVRCVSFPPCLASLIGRSSIRTWCREGSMKISPTRRGPLPPRQLVGNPLPELGFRPSEAFLPERLRASCAPVGSPPVRPLRRW